MAENIVLAEMTWPEVQEATADMKAVALVPLGATEAHGPHLPLATATYIAIDAAKRTARKLRTHGVRAIVFPNISYSVSERAADFPGTLSLSRPTALAFLKEVAQNATRNFRAVAFVNTHLDAAHLEVLKQVVEESKKGGVSACFVDLTRKRWSQQLGEAFQKGDHAGAFETSAMMALNLALVREHERISIPPMDGLVASMKKGGKTFKEAGGEDAYFGDPGAATIEDGENILEQIAEICALSVMEHLASKS
jgi:creatinine amidohydrolase